MTTTCPHCRGILPNSEFGKRTPIPTHSFDTSFGFGKHRGQTVKALINDDPAYLAWVHNNVESVVFTPEIVTEISSAILKDENKRIAKQSWPQSALTSPHDYHFDDDLDDDVPF